MIIVKTINLSPTKPINYIKNKLNPVEVVTRDEFIFATTPIKKSFDGLLYSLSSMGLMAAPKEPMKQKIWDAFMPIIEVIQGISLPLSFVVLATSICLIIVGQKRQGMQMAKWAVIGFIAMQWLPSFMMILSEVGEAMAK